MTSRPLPIPGALIAGVGFLSILALTLIPAPWREEQVSYLCLICGANGGQDVVDNLLLFIPFALGLGLAGVPFRTTMVAVIATTFFVEGMQAFLITGRDASLSDLITNSISGAMGWRLARSLESLLFPSIQAARRRVRLWAAVPVLAAALGAWFVQPAWPGGAWYGRVKPPLAEAQRFEGEVLRARLADSTFWRYRHPNTDALRRRMATRPWAVQATVTAAATPRYLAPIIGVFDGQGRKVVLLGQLGSGALFSPRSVAERLRFRPLAIRLPAAFSVSSGDTVSLTGVFGSGHIGLTSRARGALHGRVIALSPSLLWAFALPLNDPLGALRVPGTIAWLLLLYLPLGWWGARAMDPKRVAILAAVCAMAALLVVPRVAGLPLVAGWEWLAAAAGVLTGALGARATRGRF